MKVKDLIKELLQYDMDLDVTLSEPACGNYIMYDLKAVKLERCDKKDIFQNTMSSNDPKITWREVVCLT